MLTKKTLLNIAISALVIILGGASIKYLLFSAPKAQMQKPSSSGVMVETITLKPTSHHVIIPSIGTVEASAKTTLSAKVSGRIIQTSPAFIPGGIVKKGEILAQVDKNDYEFALAQTKAQLDSAKASEQIELGQQASALKELELSGLNPTGLNRSLILREPQLAQVKANIAHLEASLLNAKNNLKESAISAPYDGIITKKSAELGSFITSQSSVAEIVAINSFWLYASIPTAYLSFLDTLSNKELSSLHVTLSNSKKTLDFNARIIKLLPELDATTKQARVIIEILDPLRLQKKENSPHQTLLLGDTLNVEIHAKQYENALVIPTQFLRANNTVWVMSKENKLTIKPVEVIAKDEKSVLLAKGISPEDKIITTYLTTAVEGMDVIDVAAMKKAKKGE